MTEYTEPDMVSEENKSMKESFKNNPDMVENIGVDGDNLSSLYLIMFRCLY